MRLPVPPYKQVKFYHMNEVVTWTSSCRSHFEPRALYLPLSYAPLCLAFLSLCWAKIGPTIYGT